MKQVFLPEILAQHIAVLGKNGSGKTYATKAVIVEPLLAAGKRVAIVDPTSAWWGLRSSADGRGPGFKVLVLGGDHGDLPLPALGGAAVARLIVEQGVNLVADTGNMTVGERTRWMTDFAGTLYRLNRAPLHLVIDECHVFAPQGKVPDPDTGKMLHAVNQIAAGGRSRGIRLTMLTQRPQKLHKDTLTTADTLIAMRVLAPQDREAVKSWIDGCGDPTQGKEILGSLAQMKRGEGWVWYPEGGMLERMTFPRITTFDSSATPKDGDVPRAPKGAAEIDLSEIRAALADAVKEAEANDPKLLKQRIAELERAAKTFETRPIMDNVTTQDLREADRAGYERGCQVGAGEAREGWATITRAFRQSLVDAVEEGNSIVLKAIDKIEYKPSDKVMTATELERRMAEGPSFTRGAAWPTRLDLPAPFEHFGQFADLRKSLNGDPPALHANGKRSVDERILDALAELEQMGARQPERELVAFLAGYAHVRSAGFVKALGNLSVAGRIEYPSAGQVALTGTGRAHAKPPPKPRTARELQDRVIAMLGGASSSILRPLIDAYPRAMSRQDVAAAANYGHVRSAGFVKALGRLSVLGFVKYPSAGDVVATPILFLQ